MFRDEPAWTREEIYYIAERAHRLYRQGRFHDAGILFDGLAAVDPQNLYCRKALAAVYMVLKEHSAAVRHLNAILARDRHDAEALAGRCEALIAMKDLAAARRDFQSLSALPGGLENARRLRLLLDQAELAPDARSQQLPDGRSR
jgi:tetratricopeptide (TPR) repeat protein